jgi:hypothetical protein
MTPSHRSAFLAMTPSPKDPLVLSARLSDLATAYERLGTVEDFEAAGRLRQLAEALAAAAENTRRTQQITVDARVWVWELARRRNF